MKNKSQNQRKDASSSGHEAAAGKAAQEPSKPGSQGKPVPESAASRETFPKRTRKPGAVGLANEARPGLGTREDRGAPLADERPVVDESETTGVPRATKRGYEEPRPQPREQESDTLAHEQERSTGVSGHMGNG